jgi:hypothetical protein
MFGKIFGRRRGGDGGDGQLLAFQREVYRHTLNCFSEFDERVSGLDSGAALFSGAWQEPEEVTQLKKDCATIRELLSLIGRRLKMATSPLPQLEEPLMHVIDRVESGDVVIQNFVMTLVFKEAMLNAEKQLRDDAPD